MSPRPLTALTLFPFDPNGDTPVEDTWTFPTVVLKSQDGHEWRQAQRTRPLLTTSWQALAVDMGEAQAMAARLFGANGNNFGVPLWSSRRQLTDVAVGVYEFDDTNTMFNVVTYALVWRSAMLYDVMDMVSIGSNQVTLSGTTTFVHRAGDWIIPLGIGSMPSDWTITQSAQTAAMAPAFEVDTVNSTPLTALVPAQMFEGIPVMPFRPNFAVPSVQASIGWTEQLIGTDRGLQWREMFTPLPATTRGYAWVFDGLQEIENVRRWFQLTRGRKARFYMPTFADDLRLAVAAGAGANTLDIVACGFSEVYAAIPARLRLALLHAPDTVEAARIASVTVPSAGIERLQLTGPLVGGLQLRERLSFLVLARQGEDTLTLKYDTPALAQATWSFTELPYELPV
jgi:hypothetical protein